jgi:hypothetical protein
MTNGWLPGWQPIPAEGSLRKACPMSLASRPSLATPWWFWFVIVIGGGLMMSVFLVAALRSPARSERAIAAQASAEQAIYERQKKDQDYLQELVKLGAIRKYSCQDNETQVKLDWWLRMDADTKKTVMMAAVQYCDVLEGDARMTIIDQQSGRTLASYGRDGYQVR